MESIWDETLRKDGRIYAQKTNTALSHCTGDWAFYIQADEVVHEDDMPILQEAMLRNLGNPEVKAVDESLILSQSRADHSEQR